MRIKRSRYLTIAHIGIKGIFVQYLRRTKKWAHTIISKKSIRTYLHNTSFLFTISTYMFLRLHKYTLHDWASGVGNWQKSEKRSKCGRSSKSHPHKLLQSVYDTQIQEWNHLIESDWKQRFPATKYAIKQHHVPTKKWGCKRCCSTWSINASPHIISIKY